MPFPTLRTAPILAARTLLVYAAREIYNYSHAVRTAAVATDSTDTNRELVRAQVLLRDRDAVDLPSTVIGNEQRAIWSNGYSDGPAEYVSPAWIGDQTGHERHRISRRLPILERDKR